MRICPCSVAAVYQHFADPDRVDSGTFFCRVEGEVCFVEGKPRGESLATGAAADTGYLEWMLGQDFFDDTKVVVREALALARQHRRRAHTPA